MLVSAEYVLRCCNTPQYCVQHGNKTAENLAICRLHSRQQPSSRVDCTRTRDNADT